MANSFHDLPIAKNSEWSVIRSTTNYADILSAFKLNYKSSEYYWQVGIPHSTRSWILNLSAIKAQLPDLLELVIPFLSGADIPFRIIRDEAMAEFALNGSLGPVYLGKMISIYPRTPQDALAIAKKLILMTKSFKGPVIRTDRCLDGIVYASWGDHMTIPFCLPPFVIWPFTEITTPQIPPRPKLLNFAYYPTSIIL